MLSPEQLTEIKNAVKDSHKESTKEILIGLGVDANHPLEAQKDMAFVRWWRTFCTSVYVKAGAIIVTAFFGWDKIKVFFKE